MALTKLLMKEIKKRVEEREFEENQKCWRNSSEILKFACSQKYTDAKLVLPVGAAVQHHLELAVLTKE
jgi:hypothetical protein